MASAAERTLPNVWRHFFFALQLSRAIDTDACIVEAVGDLQLASIECRGGGDAW